MNVNIVDIEDLPNGDTLYTCTVRVSRKKIDIVNNYKEFLNSGGHILVIYSNNCSFCKKLISQLGTTDSKYGVFLMDIKDSRFIDNIPNPIYIPAFYHINNGNYIEDPGLKNVVLSLYSK